MRDECKITINIVSHGYEGQFEISDDGKAYASGPFQEKTKKKTEIQTSITRDSVLECWNWLGKNKYKISTRSESRMGFLTIQIGSKKKSVKFYRSNQTIQNNKINDMIDTLGEYFPILIKMPDLNQ